MRTAPLSSRAKSSQRNRSKKKSTSPTVRDDLNTTSRAAPSGAAYDVLRNSLIFNLVTLTNKTTTAQSNLLLEHFGIGVAASYVFAVLRLESNVLPARLCEITTMDKSVISRTLNFLEQRRYVERKPDPGHPRRELWNLTKAGEAFHESFRADMRPIGSLLLKGFSDQERATLLSLLWRVQENIPSVQAYRPAKTTKWKR